MNSKKLKANRHIYLPDITDWKSDHLDKKYCTNVKHQKFNEWFWFSPDNYKIVKIGSPACFFLITSILLLWVYSWGFPVLTFLVAITVIVSLYSLIDTLKKYDYYKDLNMYEEHLQDDIWEEQE